MAGPFDVASAATGAVLAAAPGAVLAELATPPLGMLDAAAVLQATVVGRGSDGTLLLRTASGPLALRTRLAPPTGSRIELRLLPGPPPVAQLLHIRAAPQPLAAGPAAARLDLGTRLEAVVVGAGTDGPGMAVGSRLTLRIGAPLPADIAGRPTPASPATSTPSVPMTGRVAEAAGPAGGTMLETPIGTLALGRRLAVPSGTLLAFEALATPVPPPGRDEPQIQRRDWPALAEALAALDLSAPELAARLRSALAPESGSQLAANLLFLIGALRSGIWPGAAVDQTLSAAGHDRLRLRLADDTAEWRRPDAEQGSCDWRVFVLPVLDREAVRPVEIYVRRRDAGATAGEDARFLVEAEIGRFGPLQLDGLLRKPRFDVVLRSQRTLDAALCQAVSSIFRDAAAAEGLAGDISFQTVPRFAVAPREALRSPVAVEV